MSDLFNTSEQELIDAARFILQDGLQRLKLRQSLFPCHRGRAIDAACRDARDALALSLMADYGVLRHEVAVAALIDAQGRLIGVETFPVGHATHCEVRPRLLAEMVTRTGAVAVLLAHNHPSGECAPSKADIQLTAMLTDWLDLMDCRLIDHLVLTVNDYCSIKGEW